MNGKNDNVSVVIIAQNEGRIISRCLESAAWAAEIIVVDGGSTDDTVKTAMACGAKVFQHKFEGYAGRKVLPFQKRQMNGFCRLTLMKLLKNLSKILSAVKIRRL